MTFLNDDVLDVALQDMIDAADAAVFCHGAPGDYTAATTLRGNGGNKLASRDVFPSDFAISDGTTTGRRLSLRFGQFTPAESGTHDHVALVDDDNSELIAVLETQSDVTIPSDKVGFAFNQDSVDVLEIQDPT